DLATEVAGNPQLDFDIYDRYGGVGAKPSLDNGYYVVLQHPVTLEVLESRSHIEETLFAMHSLEKPVLWFWPNVDAGADGTSTGIRSFRERFDLKNFHFFKNMEGRDFLKLLYNCIALVGNSSAGIREG